MRDKLYIDGGYHYGAGYAELRGLGILPSDLLGKEGGIYDLPGGGEHSEWYAMGYEPNPRIPVPDWVSRHALLGSDEALVDFHIQKPSQSPWSQMGSTVVPGVRGFIEANEARRKTGDFEPGTVEVLGSRLSALIFQAKLDGISEIVVKLDVEGAEFEIVNDLLATGASRCIDVLKIEWHDWMGIYSKETREHLTYRLKKDKVIVLDHNLMDVARLERLKKSALSAADKATSNTK